MSEWTSSKIKLFDEKNPYYMKFVGVIVNVRGSDVVRRVSAPVELLPDDVLEIEVSEGLYMRLSRNRDKAFGASPYLIDNATPNRAERRRQQKEAEKQEYRAHRLITLE